MNQAVFRFYANLNDFLPTRLRGRDIRRHFNADQSIKHLLEAVGVPHPEVELILANGKPVDFSYLPKDGDRISVYPRLFHLDIGGLSLVRQPDLEPWRFVADNHLGRLARYLRMIGLDTRYQQDFDDAILAHISEYEKRVLLTRDRALLKRRGVRYGYWIRSKDPVEQLREVIHRYNLNHQTAPFSRCLVCNEPLHPVTKEAVLPRLEPLTRRYFEEFSLCNRCNRVYWRGSHWERMASLMEELEIGNSPMAGEG